MKGKNRHIKIEQVYNLDNLRLADKNARRGKSTKYGPKKWDKHREENLLQLRKELMEGTYKTMSPIFEERFCDTKVRVLSKVYYKYHVAHHALMQVIMPTLEKSYYYESAASIKGRGIHYAKKHVEKYVREKMKNKSLYHVQVDCVKFYHNINRQKIYDRLCKTFTNKGIRWLLRDIIWTMGNHNGLHPDDGSKGMGIGLYPVQPLINFYLNDLDRKLSAIKGIKEYRYCDNILLVGTSKQALQEALDLIVSYSKNVLEQEVHTNYGIQTFDENHPINFVGYKIYPSYTYIRNTTKKKFKRKFKNTKGDKLRQVLVSYKGWLQHCNGNHLWKSTTHMHSYKGFSTKPKRKYVKPHNKQFEFIYKKKIYLWRHNQILKCPYVPNRGRQLLFAGMKGKL